MTVCFLWKFWKFCAFLCFLEFNKYIVCQENAYSHSNEILPAYYPNTYHSPDTYVMEANKCSLQIQNQYNVEISQPGASQKSHTMQVRGNRIWWNEYLDREQCFLSAALRSNVADYVLPLFIFFFFFFFLYSPFVDRNYSTDSHQISRNCVFWCSLNNPIVSKYFWRHLAEKNAKNSKNLVNISRVDSDCWQ